MLKRLNKFVQTHPLNSGRMAKCRAYMGLAVTNLLVTKMYHGNLTVMHGRDPDFRASSMGWERQSLCKFFKRKSFITSS